MTWKCFSFPTSS